jgi:hypothetical protein
MTADVQEEPGYHELSGKALYLALLCSSPVIIPFAYFHKIGQGCGAAACTATVALAIWNRWNLRDFYGFWIASFVCILIQIPAVLFIPWGHKGITGPALYPVAALDAALVYGCLKIAELLARKKRAMAKI